MKDEDRFLRLFVMFDLPVVDRVERKRASQFRKLLIRNGFFMIQFSIYCRLCRGQDNTEKYKKKIKSNLPFNGNIRMLQITEKQFERMEILLGEIRNSEKFKDKQLLLF